MVSWLHRKGLLQEDGAYSMWGSPSKRLVVLGFVIRPPVGLKEARGGVMSGRM